VKAVRVDRKMGSLISVRRAALHGTAPLVVVVVIVTPRSGNFELPLSIRHKSTHTHAHDAHRKR